MRVALALVAVFYAAAAAAAAAVGPAPILVVPGPTGVQLDVVPGQPVAVAIAQLAADSVYELRVNYIGTFPADFRIEWQAPSTAAAHHHTRTLLDTEKLVFRTDSTARVVSLPTDELGAPAVALITAVYNGISPLADAPHRAIPVRLVLEPLLGGALPSSLVWLVGVMVFALVLALRFVVPRVVRLLLAAGNPKAR